MRDIETVLTRVRRLRETQQINGVQHIGFALSVEPYEAVEFGTEFQTRLADVPVIENI